MEDVRVLTDARTIKALADPLRIAILRELTAKPMTAKQLATFLGEPPARVHYHVKELARANLIELVETREKSGILEKYYSAVARRFVVDRAVGNLNPDGIREVKSSIGLAITHACQEIKRSLEKTGEPGAGPASVLCLDYGYWTPEEARAVAERLHNTLQEAIDRAQAQARTQAQGTFPVGPEADPGRRRRRYMALAAICPVDREA